MSNATVTLRFCGVHRSTDKALGISDLSECMLLSRGDFLTWIPRSVIRKLEKQTDTAGFYHEIVVMAWFFKKNEAALARFVNN